MYQDFPLKNICKMGDTQKPLEIEQVFSISLSCHLIPDKEVRNQQ